MGELGWDQPFIIIANTKPCFRTLTKRLGSGEFGDVCKASWSISGTTKVVAVKTLKPGSSESDRVRFLQEAAIMGQFNHPHVVKLYGIVTKEDPVSSYYYIILSCS